MDMKRTQEDDKKINTRTKCHARNTQKGPNPQSLSTMTNENIPLDGGPRRYCRTIK
jgi:hypothetical protein